MCTRSMPRPGVKFGSERRTDRCPPRRRLPTARFTSVVTNGKFYAFNAQTGAVKWKERFASKNNLPGLFSASPVSVDGRIYLFDRLGLTTVIDPGDAFKVVARNELDDGCMASPAVAGKSFVMRTRTALYRIGK